MSSLSKRITSGIVFFIVVAGALLCSCTFLPLTVAIGALMMSEYYSMTLGKRFFVEQILMILAATLAFVFFFLKFKIDLNPDTCFWCSYLFATCISFIYTSTRDLRRGDADEGVSRDTVNSVAHLMMPALYIGPVATCTISGLRPNGVYTPWLLLKRYDIDLAQ